MDENPRIAELRKKLEKDPGSRLFAQLAEELRKEGRFVDAIGICRKGLEKNPNYPSARLTLARALLDSGSPQEAEPELQQIVKASPDNILAARLLGEAFEDLGQVNEALQQFERTLRLAPGDKGILDKIGELKLRRAAAAYAPPPVPGTGLVDVGPASIPEVAVAPSVFDNPEPRPLEPAVASSPVAPTVSEALDRDLASGTLTPGALTVAEIMHFETTNASSPSELVTEVPPEPEPEPEVAETIGFGHAETVAFNQIPGLSASAEPPSAVDQTEAVEVAFAASDLEPIEVQTIAFQTTEAPPYPPLPADDPDYGAQTLPLTSMTLADLYLQQGLKAEASAVLSQVLKEEPENTRAQSKLDAVSSELASAELASPDLPAPSVFVSEPEVHFTSPEAAEFEAATEPLALTEPGFDDPVGFAEPEFAAEAVVGPSVAPHESRPRSRAEVRERTVVSLKALLSAVERESIQQRATERGAI